MLICDSCGAVFEYSSTQMDNDTGCIESKCPECGCRHIMQAAFCKMCEDYAPEDECFGYGSNTVCIDCLQEKSNDLDLLYAATKDECEEFDLPVLFRTFFTDDEITEVLMRELKFCHAHVPRDTKAFVRRYANEIADEIVKELEGKNEN